MTLHTPLAAPKVTIHNGKAVTTSLDVADYFDKLHKNVIRSIESLDCSPKFTELNFEPSEYTDSTGRKLPMYTMTKDGFVFLVMGFTGKKAAAFKEAYIAEFNRMEASLSSAVQPAAAPKHIKIKYINTLTGISAQKIGDKTQQSTTIHDIFINNLPLISTCQPHQNRPNLTAELPTFDEGNSMRYSRFASANSGAGIRVLPEVTATK